MVSRGALGLDHATRPRDYRAFAREAVERGYSFEFRYLCDPKARTINQTKILRPGEAQAAQEEGLEVLLIWQNTKHDAERGYEGGLWDGQHAAYQAVFAGYPEGSTLYFAIADYDAPYSHHEQIASYLCGVREAVGDLYQIGGYGKVTVTDDMLKRGLIHRAWQHMAWAKGHVSSRSHLRQRPGPDQVTVGGILCDVNDCYTDDAGEWRTMRVTRELIRRLRAEGLAVPEMAGWESRGGAISLVNFLVWHATATGTNWTDEKLRNLLRDGRADLDGPLSQFGLERDGELPIIAAGRANHNGYGEGGNQTWAVEAANNNLGEPWSAAMIDVWVRASAVICLYLRKDPAKFVRAHKETDPRRKTDPVGLPMANMRAYISLHMLRMSGITGTPEPVKLNPSIVINRGMRLNGFKEALMIKTIEIPLGDTGQGWAPCDGRDGRPHVPWGTLLGPPAPQGSDPSREGYWPIPESGIQNKDGNTLIVVEGGMPNGKAVLFLTVPDAA